MDILSGLLNPTPPKSRKDSGKKARRPRTGKRKAGARRKNPHVEMTAAEVVREALLRG